VDAHPGPLPTPPLGATLRVGEVDELLPGEEAAAHVGHRPLHAGLVLRRADPGRVDHEPAGLGVLHERVGQPRRHAVGLGHDRGEVVGDQHGEHPAEERPGRLTAGDHVLQRLAVAQPHEQVPGEHRREDQRVDHPAGLGDRVEEEAHPAEVDLQLLARLAVVDPHRRLVPAVAQLLGAEPVQRALRHHHPAAGQQLTDLHHRQPVLEPPSNPGPLGLAALPRLTTPTRTRGPHRLHHRADQLVGQRLLAGLPGQPCGLGRLHVAADGLAVRRRQRGDRAQALPPHPQPQHLTNLGHGHLPVRHAPSRSTAMQDAN
jgi:hypothetical protein